MKFSAIAARTCIEETPERKLKIVMDGNRLDEGLRVSEIINSLGAILYDEIQVIILFGQFA